MNLEQEFNEVKEVLGFLFEQDPRQVQDALDALQIIEEAFDELQRKINKEKA